MFDIKKLGDQLSKIEPQNATYEAIPSGAYDVFIESAEVVKTKAGTGHYIKLKIKVDGGSHDGRYLFTNLNVDNPNSTAVEIGLRDLQNILMSSGKSSEAIAQFSDINDLFGLKFRVKTQIQSSAQWGDQAVIKQYLKREEEDKILF